MVVERLLHRRQALGLAEALDRRDLGAVDGGDRGQARAARLAVDEHGAGAAAALLAAGLRARDVELLAEDAQERRERRARDLVLDPVDGQVHAGLQLFERLTDEEGQDVRGTGRGDGVVDGLDVLERRPGVRGASTAPAADAAEPGRAATRRSLPSACAAATAAIGRGASAGARLRS